MGANTFSEKLLRVLRAHPAGISEFDLIKWLERDGQAGFDKDCLRGNLSLFQSHFLLFHTLYRLRDELRTTHADVHLDISPLCIQLIPHTQDPTADIDRHDPLHAYYLDLNHLKNTNNKDVDTLLKKFWQRFISNDERRSALDELGLQDPVDWPAIKTRHRQLAMQHHPDRGGDESRLQTINAAMDTLARSYK